MADQDSTSLTDDVLATIEAEPSGRRELALVAEVRRLRTIHKDLADTIGTLANALGMPKGVTDLGTWIFKRAKSPTAWPPARLNANRYVGEDPAPGFVDEDHLRVFVVGGRR